MTSCMCVPNFWRNTLPPLSEQHSCRCHMDWPLGVKCLIKTHLYLHDLMHSCHQKYSIRTAGMYSTPYRLDLAPSDYHLFGYLKDNMRGQQCKKADTIQELTHIWLQCDELDFYWRRILQPKQ